MKIRYRWHPMHGQQVQVTQCVGRHGYEVLHIDSDFGRPREIPAWMTEAATCSLMSLGCAQVSVEALVELRRLLDLSAPTRSSSEASAQSESPHETDTEADQRSVEFSPVRGTPRGSSRRNTRSADRGTFGTIFGSTWSRDDLRPASNTRKR